jgi:hypothetical protein
MVSSSPFLVEFCLLVASLHCNVEGAWLNCHGWQWQIWLYFCVFEGSSIAGFWWVRGYLQKTSARTGVCVQGQARVWCERFCRGFFFSFRLSWNFVFYLKHKCAQIVTEGISHIWVSSHSVSLPTDVSSMRPLTVDLSIRPWSLKIVGQDVHVHSPESRQRIVFIMNR